MIQQQPEGLRFPRRASSKTATHELKGRATFLPNASTASRGLRFKRQWSQQHPPGLSGRASLCRYHFNQLGWARAVAVIQQQPQRLRFTRRADSTTATHELKGRATCLPNASTATRGLRFKRQWGQQHPPGLSARASLCRYLFNQLGCGSGCRGDSTTTAKVEAHATRGFNDSHP